MLARFLDVRGERRHRLKVAATPADGSPEGYTAIPDPVANPSSATKSPSRRPTAAPADGQGRFSPLNAPQRAAIDSFLAEARPWAERQARRSYRHLPAELQADAIDRAFLKLRTSAPHDFTRRELHRDLARALDSTLRDIHEGWCLNQTTLPNAPAPTDGPDKLTGFIEEGLGGLERAVLQLEIGAGRDSATVRAALKLGPSQYARHRDLGLSKLRSAIAGQVAGSVCAHHLDAVTLAVTGDRDAAAELASGPGRCRSCAREAGALQGLLHRRLAAAPWPLAIKPAGFFAAKLGALGALFGGKGAAGGAGAGSFAAATSGTGLKAVAAVMAAAAVATGGVAVVEPEQAERAVQAAAATGASSTASPAARASGSPSAPATEAPAGRERITGTGKKSRSTAKRDAMTTPATTSDESPPAQTQQPSTSLPSTTSVPKPTDVVDRVTARTRETLDRVKKAVPKVDPANPALPDVGTTLDSVADAGETLLKP